MLLFSLLLFVAPGLAMTAEEILDHIDENMVFDTRSAQLSMTVTRGKRVKSYEMQTFGRGTQEAAVEFIAPARDKGTKMLKRDEELWMYLPAIEKVQKISGHMLRQGMMGSDFSYEDMMEATELRIHYDAVVTGEETWEERPCWKMELTAKDTKVAYPKRIVWVDQEYQVPLRQELYALSGMLLKVWSMNEVKDFNGRHFPTRMHIADQLRNDSFTEIRFENLAFSVDLEEEVFSMRWLER